MPVKKKPATKRKARVSGTSALPAVGRVPKKRKSIGAIGKGRAIVGKIDSLERLRKQEKNREMRDIIQAEINLQHDKLDALKKVKKTIR